MNILLLLLLLILIIIMVIYREKIMKLFGRGDKETEINRIKKEYQDLIGEQLDQDTINSLREKSVEELNQI